jgi:hypothetical protein
LPAQNQCRASSCLLYFLMGHTETSFRYKIYTIKDPGVKFLSNLHEE